MYLSFSALSLSPQFLRRLPRCDAAAPATLTWPDAPGLSPLTLRRCATSPLTGKNLPTWRSSRLSAVSCDSGFAELVYVSVCFLPCQWDAPTAGHQHLSSHPTCGFVLRLGPGCLSAGSASVFSLAQLPGSRLSSCNVKSRLSKWWPKIVNVFFQKIMLYIHTMTGAAVNHRCLVLRHGPFSGLSWEQHIKTNQQV